MNRLKSTILNIVFILSYFDVFNLTPFAFLTDLFKLLVSCWGIYLFIRFWRRLPITFNLFLVIFTLLSCVTFYTSATILNQPWSSSLVSISNFGFCFGVIPFYFFSEKYGADVYLYDFERVFKIVIWINFFIVIIFSAFSITLNIVSPLSGSVIELNPARVPRILIELATFYYFIRFIKSGNPLLLMFSMLFILAFHSYDIQRMVLLTTFFTIGIYLISNLKNKIAFIVSTGALLVFAIVLVVISFSTRLDNYLSDFGEAFKIFSFSADGISEKSVSARIYEIQYAMFNFYKHPIFGNGIPRSSLKSQLLDDEYFYISDVGVFGILYAFGIFGILIYLVQCFISFRSFLNKKINNRIFWMCTLYLVYVCVKSFATASTILNAHSFMFVFMIAIISARHEEVAIIEEEITDSDITDAGHHKKQLAAV